MEKVRIIKILIVVLALFGVIAFFGLYFFKGNPGSDLLSTDLSGTSAQGGEIFQALNDLRSLKIDDSVFKIPAYDTLEDFSTSVQAEDKQRPNPYAPIGLEDRGLGNLGGIQTPKKKAPNE